jgi:hypothetical protein
VRRGPSDALRQQLEPHRAPDHWFAALSHARVFSAIRLIPLTTGFWQRFVGSARSNARRLDRAFVRASVAAFDIG